MGDQQKQGDQGSQNQRGQQDADKSRMGNKPGAGAKPGADQGLVGQDTDDDGKTVKPGQRPGQSHGTGQIKKDS